MSEAKRPRPETPTRKAVRLAKRAEKTITELPGMVQDPDKRRRVWTRAEAMQQESNVEYLMLYSSSGRQIESTMLSRYGVGRKRTQILIRRIKDRWAIEDEQNRACNKSSAVRRILGYIAEEKNREKPDMTVIARFEQQLADIQGLKAPIEVNVTTQAGATVAQYIGELSAEELQAKLERFRALKEKARWLELGQGTAVERKP